MSADDRLDARDRSEPVEHRRLVVDRDDRVAQRGEGPGEPARPGAEVEDASRPRGRAAWMASASAGRGRAR